MKGGTFTTRPKVISRLSYDVVAKQLPYPLAHRYVAMIGDSIMAPDRIARLTLPPLDEGSALQLRDSVVRVCARRFDRSRLRGESVASMNFASRSALS